MSRLEWEEGFDDNDNSTWSADSALGSEEDGRFVYRLKPMLVNNAIAWDATETDAELCLEAPAGGCFASLDEAKAACEEVEEEVFDHYVSADDDASEHLGATTDI